MQAMLPERLDRALRTGLVPTEHAEMGRQLYLDLHAARRMKVQQMTEGRAKTPLTY